ncbi:LacI family DNA-binding transcriptional regulator [Roseateles chitosanitabidus]|uniref:LacI family DNA-binding transcriptional regulator n=1 Tax=Roseateles chitosanitabidus TaxID=65048 RepID=UPI000835AADB|nr:LacI family DNA-binding transcriptional regulator [Roseateles chitosanitabidus]MBO9687437.1 LacI family DNA-binding transcriptional regulator [Roseateles chitosanitabidus]
MTTASAPKRRRATGRVTLQDVALAAGVSPITASRALRGERSVAADLVERVTTAVAQLGYVPDPAARALASARSNQVVVLIPLLSNTLFVDLLDAAQRTLLAAGYQSLIGVTHYRADEEEALLRTYLMNRPAGLLVTGFDHTEAAHALIHGSGVPCVHVMENRGAAPGAADAEDGGEPYSVGFSQQAAGHAMTAELLRRGYRRIAFAAAQLDPRTLQRAQGYRAALGAAHDPRLEFMDAAPSSFALGAKLLERVMREAPDVDAIFFNNDDLAQGALLQALRLGLRVPERIAVVGFNDLTGGDQMLPPLSTVRTPRGEIGLHAARMLVALMRGEDVPERRVDLGFELVMRSSC